MPLTSDTVTRFSSQIFRVWRHMRLSSHFRVFSIGFVLYFKEEPILGYCVDSGFREDVFEFFFQASTVIVDARDNGTKEHASVSTLFPGIKN